jgi:iron complex outermembrane recepter protein
MKKVLILSAVFCGSLLLAQETKTEITPAKKDSLSPKVTNLEEVKIISQKKFIKVDSDKTTISIKDNPLLSTGNSYEAVKKLPGVIASPIGGLTLNGKGVSIFIDGSPSTLSGSDLENYLASLPANAIEKVELIYNPGASFDANANGSVINIVTSNRKMKGVSGNFNINYNFNKYQKPSPQFLFNGKEKNLSWQTTIGYNYIDRENNSKNGQTFTSFNPDKNIDQGRFTVITNRNFYFRVGTNYKLNKSSNLLFNYNSNFANDRDTFDANTTGSDITKYTNIGSTKDKNNNHEISLQYKTKLDTLGRTFDITAFTNVYNKNPNSSSNAFQNNVPSYINYTNKFDLLNYYLKYDFAIPFEKLKFTLNTGGKYNTIDVTNIGKYNINNPVQSIINFDYKETNLAFYTELRKKVKKFNFTVGLRYEDFNVDRTGIVDAVKTDLNFKNKNLFPNVSVLYDITDNVNVSTSYARKISQPNYQVLDPNGSNFDQYNSSQGNLLLKPSFFDNYDFKISAMQFVQIGANYTVSKDHNLFIFSAKPGELVSTQTFQQFDKFKTFSAYANFPIPLDYFFKGKEEFKKRMSNTDKMNYIYLSINYIKSLTTGYALSFEPKPVWNYAAQAQIILPWDVKSSFSYFILPTGTWEIYQITRPIQQFDMSFNKDFLNKNLKIGIHAFDLFNTNEINALVSSTNLETKFYEKQDSRNFRISLSYNFGNLKLEKESTEIEIEKVKSGGGLVK